MVLGGRFGVPGIERGSAELVKFPVQPHILWVYKS